MYVCTFICEYVITCIHPPPAQPAKPEAQPARPEAQPARPKAQPARPEAQPVSSEVQPARHETQPARPEAQTASQTSGFRPGWLAQRGEWTDLHLYLHTSTGKISPFYRTIRAAALLPKGRSRSIKRSRAREPLTI